MLKKLEQKRRSSPNLGSKLLNAESTGIEDWYAPECVRSVLAEEYDALIVEALHDGAKEHIAGYWSEILTTFEPEESIFSTSKQSRSSTDSVQSDNPITGNGLKIRNLSEVELGQLKSYSQTEKVEFETLCAAAWSVLVGRRTRTNGAMYSMVKEICPVTDPDQACKLVDFPLATQWAPKQTLGEWLQELQRSLVKKNLFGDSVNLGIELPDFLQNLGLKTQYETKLILDSEQQPYRFMPENNDQLIVRVRKSNDGIRAYLQFVPEWFPQSEAEAMVSSFVDVLLAIPKHAQMKIAALPVGPKRSRRVLDRLEKNQ